VRNRIFWILIAGGLFYLADCTILKACASNFHRVSLPQQEKPGHEGGTSGVTRELNRPPVAQPNNRPEMNRPNNRPEPKAERKAAPSDRKIDLSPDYARRDRLKASPAAPAASRPASHPGTSRTATASANKSSGAAGKGTAATASANRASSSTIRAGRQNLQPSPRAIPAPTTRQCHLRPPAQVHPPHRQPRHPAKRAPEPKAGAKVRQPAKSIREQRVGAQE